MRSRMRAIAIILLSFIGAVILLIGLYNQEEILADLGIAMILITLLTFVLGLQEGNMNELIRGYFTYIEALCKVLNELGFEGNAIFIPMRKIDRARRSIIFVPQMENFDIDIARIEDSHFFISSRASMRHSGVTIPSPGHNIVRIMEESLGKKLIDLDPESVDDFFSLLKEHSLITDLKIRSNRNELFIKYKPAFLHPEVKSGCGKRVPCPVCSAILQMLSEMRGELIMVESIKRGKDRSVIIRATSLGGISKWI